MAGLIDIYKSEYDANLTLALQQFGSKLEPYVKSFDGLEGTKAKLEHRVDAKDAISNTDSFRTALTAQADIVSRWVVFDRGVYETGVEKIEKIQAGIDPTGEYVRNGAAAIGRFVDDKIIAAATGNAITGTDGTGTTALPAGQTIAHGSTGWTRAKMDTVQEKLEEAEVDMDREMVVAVISPKAHTDLRNIDAYVNWDNNSARPLEGHTPKSFMGIHKFIISNRLNVATNIRDCIVFTSEGLALGNFGVGMETDIRELPSKTGKPLLIEALRYCGAARLDENRVIVVEVDES